MFWSCNYGCALLQNLEFRVFKDCTKWCTRYFFSFKTRRSGIQGVRQLVSSYAVSMLMESLQSLPSFCCMPLLASLLDQMVAHNLMPKQLLTMAFGILLWFYRGWERTNYQQQCQFLWEQHCKEKSHKMSTAHCLVLLTLKGFNWAKTKPSWLHEKLTPSTYLKMNKTSNICSNSTHYSHCQYQTHNCKTRN